MHEYEVIEGKSAEERERLILEHLPQVRLIARRIQPSCRRNSASQPNGRDMTTE